MESGRADYNEMIKIRSLHAGESYWFARAQDDLSGPNCRDYASRLYAAYRERFPDEMPVQVLAHIELVLQQADRLDAFSPKKLPDIDEPPGTTFQQLAFQLSRRDWAAGIDAAPDGALQAAERRGEARAMGRYRHALSLLRQILNLRATPGPDSARQLEIAFGQAAALVHQGEAG